jgi:hypothetical protein
LGGLPQGSAGVLDRQSPLATKIQAPAAQAQAKQMPRPEHWQPKGRFLISCQSMMRTCFHICEQQYAMSIIIRCHCRNPLLRIASLCPLPQPIETAKTAFHATMRLFSDYHPVFKNKI